MIKVNSREAKTRFSELLRKVEQSREAVVICRNGVPIAKLVPWGKRNPLRQSPQLRNVIFREDPSRPLADPEWPESAR